MHNIIVVRRHRGLGFPESARLVKQAVLATLTAERVSTPCCLDITFTNNTGIQALNREFRGLDKPTDVLSFPLNVLEPGSFDPSVCDWDYDRNAIPLGDMILSLERCAAQAIEYEHSYARELQYLTVHSTLHLLGYDHTDEGEQKQQMRAKEKEIMATLAD